MQSTLSEDDPCGKGIWVVAIGTPRVFVTAAAHRSISGRIPNKGSQKLVLGRASRPPPMTAQDWSHGLVPSKCTLTRAQSSLRPRCGQCAMVRIEQPHTAKEQASGDGFGPTLAEKTDSGGVAYQRISKNQKTWCPLNLKESGNTSYKANKQYKNKAKQYEGNTIQQCEAEQCTTTQSEEP
jgi:hypothetical protein